MISEDVIIIVPTKGRQNYLNRVAYYYSQFDMHVYICDAYKISCDIDFYDKIHYLWDPNKGFFEEIIDVIEKTNAKYYLLSPDDDFIKYETCIECYEEMEKDDAVVLGTGRQLLFNENYDGKFIYSPSLNRLAPKEKQIFGRSDLKEFWSGYQNIHWSLFRKEFLINVLKKLEFAKYNNANFTELTIGFEALQKNKIYMSSKYLNYREVSSMPHWGSITTATNWKNFILTSELRSDLKRLNDIYRGDIIYILRSLYYYLGTPFLLFKRNIHTKSCLPISCDDDKVVYDEIMDRRISEAMKKMQQL